MPDETPDAVDQTSVEAGRTTPDRHAVLSAVEQRARGLLLRPDQTTLRVHWQFAPFCNYHCPYCNADREGLKVGARWSLEQMKGAWRRFTADHGPCQISVSGMEPMFGEKNFAILSWLAEDNVLDIDTNFSFPLSILERFTEPDNVFFSTSYHPSGGVPPDDFIHKVHQVQARGFTVTCASLVCYPPYLEHVDEWRRQFEDGGVLFLPRPFYGTYEGRQFPQEYNEAELEILRRHLSRDSLQFQLNLKPTRGALCATGWLYCLITADGTVARCPQDVGDLGGMNFYRDRVVLRDHPTPCAADHCWCEDLWHYHLSEDEAAAYRGS